MHLREELEYRGQIYQVSDEGVFELYNKGGQALYLGCDPSADSLHLGNFATIMNAVQYMKRGNHFVLIVGGATGMIGDPGGKSTERNLLDKKTLQYNLECIHKQVNFLLDNLNKLTGENFSFEIKNNADFYEGMGALDFLRDIGKHITVNQMMNKETVKRRLEDPDQSISYTEFSYMLLQGYDFVKLYQDKKVRLQICGSDQRGNGVTGLELIRKMIPDAQQCFVTTCPLILDSAGKKFGKSEGNALWLSTDKNSPYVIYQYFMNTIDEDIGRYLKLLTLLSKEQIENIVTTHLQHPELRYGQRQLAIYVTTTIFGQEAANTAAKVTEILFGDPEQSLSLLRDASPEELKLIGQELDPYTLSNEQKTQMKNGELRLIDLCTASGLTPSNGEAKKLIQSGALTVNNIKIDAIDHSVTIADLQNNSFLLLRKGKKTYKIIFC